MNVSETLSSPSLALNAHLEATKTGDAALLRRAFSKDARFVGTDDTEVWSINKLAELLESTKGEGWEMKLTEERQFMAVFPGVISFLEFLTHVEYWLLRGSGVVCLDSSGQWRIHDYVLSFSVPNEVVDHTNLLELLRG